MILNKPLVSAIISTYNSEKFIRGKIEDLLLQSIADELEIIVVNSGSLQNEDAIIKEYLSDHQNIKYIHTKERETIYKAWNRGIAIAKGKYITNSNTDDRLRSDAFEIMADYLDANPETMLVYADQVLTTVENQKFNEVKRNKVIKFPSYTHFKQLERCIVGSQPMWRASLHAIDNLWFDDKYEVCGDHEFELKISEKYIITHLNQLLGTFYKSPTRSNKEYENPDKVRIEVREITDHFIDRYLNSLSKAELTIIRNQYKINILLPILVYELIKRIEKLFFPGIYPKFFFHSIEFIYYLNILIYEKENNLAMCDKLSKKFLKYKRSDRISEKQLKLKTGIE
ncbi:MAG: glycosyltransferase [Melioribacteraceae bacterium]